MVAMTSICSLAIMKLEPKKNLYSWLARTAVWEKNSAISQELLSDNMIIYLYLKQSII